MRATTPPVRRDQEHDRHDRTRAAASCAASCDFGFGTGLERWCYSIEPGQPDRVEHELLAAGLAGVVIELEVLIAAARERELSECLPSIG